MKAASPAPSLWNEGTNVEYRNLIRMRLHEQIQTDIREQCGDTYTINADGSYFLALPESCDIQFQSELLQTEINKLIADQELYQNLRLQVAEYESVLGSMKNAISLNQSLLGVLQARTRQ